MNTLLMCIVALMLWFIWRQLETIARALTGLYKIAASRNVDTLRQP